MNFSDLWLFDLCQLKSLYGLHHAHDFTIHTCPHFMALKQFKKLEIGPGVSGTIQKRTIIYWYYLIQCHVCHTHAKLSTYHRERIWDICSRQPCGKVCKSCQETVHQDEHTMFYWYKHLNKLWLWKITLKSLVNKKTKRKSIFTIKMKMRCKYEHFTPTASIGGWVYISP